MNAITLLLAKHNISQSELARRFGIPLRTVQNWAEGTRSPSEWVVNLLTAALEHNGK